MNKKLNAFHLKIIAIIAMTINHLGQNFAPKFNPIWWEFTYQFIGKLTFPIMAYLLIEGYRHTKRFKNYVLRLALFGVLAILPYHYVLIKTESIYIFNNILFTLTIGLIMLKLIDTYPKYEKYIVFISSVLTFASDWNIFGILILHSFYHNKSFKQLIIITISMTIIQIAFTGQLIYLATLGILMVIPLLKAYNGQKGFSNNLIKYGFYIYYPLHLKIIILLQVIYDKL